MSEQTTTKTAPRGNTGPSRGGSGAPRGNGRGGQGAGGRGGSRGGRPSFAERPKPEFEQKTLDIRRVTRVVSGGRRFAFSVVLAIGDKKGSFGIGTGKAQDTALAIQKAYNDAKRNMMKLKLTEKNSITHDVKAKYNSGRVFLMPNKGRGVVVGSSMRALVELAGIHDVTGRVLSGTKNKLNIARATAKALEVFTMKRGA
ncbi:MAG: 30S ribosomal protein S5 [Candidatus Pacebacteria bacterium]|nr:30S ribosomal protein S5 [Candidatus Paceibacterota bacterium]